MITEQLIKEFNTMLQKYCAYVYEYYDEPLPDNEIIKVMNQLGIENEDYFQLYKWRNGISSEKLDYSVECCIVMPGNFVSLKDAVKIDQRNSIEDEWSKKSLKPIMTNYEGEFLLLETDKQSEYSGYIYFYSPNFSYSIIPILSYESIEKLLLTIIQLFKENAQWFNKGTQRLEIDYEKVYPICQIMNPNCDWATS